MNQNQLTQKEKLLLQDLKSQEELCIKKYNKYANEAGDNVLKQLFRQLGSHEEQHLNTINQILGGQNQATQSAQMSAQPQQSQQVWNQSQGAQQQGQQSMQAGSQSQGTQQGQQSMQAGSQSQGTQQQGMQAGSQWQGGQQQQQTMQAGGQSQSVKVNAQPQQAQVQQSMQAGQSGQSTQNFTPTSNLKSPNASQKDFDLVHDLLSTEKYVSATYNTAIFEFNNSQIRKTLNHIQKEEQEHGELLYNYLKQNNAYPLQA